jgi:hypothetical protein
MTVHVAPTWTDTPLVLGIVSWETPLNLDRDGEGIVVLPSHRPAHSFLAFTLHFEIHNGVRLLLPAHRAEQYFLVTPLNEEIYNGDTLILPVPRAAHYLLAITLN